MDSGDGPGSEAAEPDSLKRVGREQLNLTRPEGKPHETAWITDMLCVVGLCMAFLWGLVVGDHDMLL